MKNVRIDINDLIKACRRLGEVKVVAAGSMYATLECDLSMQSQLTMGGILWAFD